MMGGYPNSSGAGPAAGDWRPPCVPRMALPDAFHLNQWIGLVVLALVGWLMYRTGKRGEKA